MSNKNLTREMEREKLKKFFQSLNKLKKKDKKNK